MMKGALKLLGVCFLSAILFACGGGGGGGGVVEPTATLKGTVTDTNLEPVAGVTVSAPGIRSTTTDAAGRYTLGGFGTKAFLITFTPPTSSHFPAAASVSLTRGKITALDVYLAKADGQPLANAENGGVVTSTSYINAVQQSDFTLAAGDLEDGTGAAYTGTATIHVTPIDVGKPGHGLATYQPNLNMIPFRALTGSPTTTIELLGAAAVACVDATGNPLALAAGSTSILTLPVPAFPAGIRTVALANGLADLWYYDPATGALGKHTAQATYNPGTGTGPYYEAPIDRPGIWLAGVEHATPETIMGTLLFSDSTPAAGATIYAVGDDHGFANVTTTDQNGSFTMSAKSGGALTLHYAIYSRGAQLPYQLSLTGLNAVNALLGAVTLPYGRPPATGPATGIAVLDTVPTNDDPQQIGYILAAGRQIRDDGNASLNVADVTFLANDFPIYGVITLTPTASGSGIQVVSNATFTTLTTAPATGYFDQNANEAAYTVGNLETATLPILVAVRTAQGHYGKISIDSVVQDPVTPSRYQVTFRHAFSLTRTF